MGGVEQMTKDKMVRDIEPLSMAATTIGRLAVSVIMIAAFPFLAIVIGIPAGIISIFVEWLDAFKRLWKDKK